MPKLLSYTGDDAIPQNDAWADTLTVAKQSAAGVSVPYTVPTRARIAMYATRAKAGAAVLTLDSQAGADALITLTQTGDTFTISWDKVVTLAHATYYGDLQLDWTAGAGTPWTPVKIILEIGVDYAG